MQDKKDFLKTSFKGYEIKSVKLGIGHDLAGYNLKLYKDGKKVATVDDDGRGGEIDFYWETDKAENEFNSFIKREYVLRKPTWKPENELEKEVGFLFTDGIFIEELINRWNTVKDWKRICKKGIIVQVGEHIGTTKYNLVKKVPMSHVGKVEEFYKQKNPNKEILILNKVLQISPRARATTRKKAIDVDKSKLLYIKDEGDFASLRQDGLGQVGAVNPAEVPNVIKWCKNNNVKFDSEY
jgi:hypothetical protein